MAKKHECPDYGKNYEDKHEECLDCADAQKCHLAMNDAAIAKKKAPAKKGGKGKGQAMSQCFW